jgi:predicted dehydrogenase
MNEMTRRQFLNASLATAGVTGAAASAARGSGVVSALAGVHGTVLGANERVRVALIGSGGRGRRNLEMFLKRDDVECPLVCDVDDAMIDKAVRFVEESRKKRPEATKDFRRVVDRKDIDVCLVATPDHWHALPTICACRAGKDVYVEKPLATTIAEGGAMVAAARKHNCIVQMGTQWRSGEHFREAIEYIHSGKLGKVRFVRCWAYLPWVGSVGKPKDAPPPAGVDYDMWLGPAPKRPFNPARFHFSFRWFWDYAGGLMTDWGVHLINLVHWAMKVNAPTRVSCSGGKYVFDDISETPDTQCAVYDYPGFTMVWEHEAAGGNGPDGRQHGAAFYGSEGMLVLDAHGWDVTVDKDKKRRTEKHQGGGEGEAEHVSDFLDGVRSRRRPAEDVEIGHAVSAAAHLGNLALLSGRSVRWDAQTEQVIGDDDLRNNRMLTRPYRPPWRLPSE